MSIVAVVSTLDGIAMSADGRLSDMREVGGEKIYYPVSDNSEKITLMRENTIAVGYFGEPAVFDNKTVTTMLDMLDERGIRKRDSVRMVAEKVRETFCFRYNLFGLTFFVAGYDKDEPFVYFVNFHNITRVNEQDSEILHGLWYGGSVTHVMPILDTFTFDPKLTPIGDAIDIAELAVDFSGKYNKYFHLDETVGGKIRTVRINRDGAEFLF